MASTPGIPDAHEHHVGAKKFGLADGFGAVADLADDLGAVVGLQQHPEAELLQRLIIDDENPDHADAGSVMSRRGRPVRTELDPAAELSSAADTALRSGERPGTPGQICRRQPSWPLIAS
jgi:hypothetical protein